MLHYLMLIFTLLGGGHHFLLPLYAKRKCGQKTEKRLCFIGIPQHVKTTADTQHKKVLLYPQKMLAKEYGDLGGEGWRRVMFVCLLWFFVCLALLCWWHPFYSSSRHCFCLFLFVFVIRPCVILCVSWWIC